MKAKNLYVVIGAIVGWFAVIAQFSLLVSEGSLSFGQYLAQFIGYFTITTNTLVALCYTFYGLKGTSLIGKWIIRPDSIFAITVFIVIVGLIYHTILRPLSEFSGFPLLITELLHTVQPIGFMLFWICFISKDGLTWKGFLPWLLYPLLYILYVMILGALTAHYPYPFADASKLGYPKALLNGMGVLFLIATLALILLGLAKLTFSHKKTHHP